MAVNKFSILALVFFVFHAFGLTAQNQAPYKDYYNEVIEAEVLITKKEYAKALKTLENVFDLYDFIFLTEYKVAAQLALQLGSKEKALHFLKLGVLGGWKLQEIKKNEFLKPIRKTDGWKALEAEYDSLRTAHFDGLNPELREEVRLMYKNDQKYAISYLLKIGEGAKTKYATKKIIPQSEEQLARLNEILDESGYPGEKLIGNSVWMMIILSHHNSISQDYSEKDTIYPLLKPRLFEAIDDGEMSPYEYAIIEDWYVAVKSNRKEAAFGFLNTLSEEDLSKSNELRKSVGMRSVETRNALVDIQNQTGMDFYLAGEGWVTGKIEVDNNNESIESDK